MGRVYAIASAKGGVGKTTTTANLGVVLAAGGHRTAVVDADIGMPNLGRLLGVDPDGATLHDVLAGEAEPLDAVYEGPAGLDVVPGSMSLDAYAKANPQNFPRVLDALADYDVVLVDTGAGLNHDTLRPLTLADEAVLVSTPSPDALVDTEKTKQLADRFDVPVAGLVLTRVDTARVDTAALTAEFEVDLLTVVPEDPRIGNESGDDAPLGPDTDTPAAAAYRSLAEALGFGGSDEPTGEDDAAVSAVDDETDADADAAEADVDSDVDAAEADVDTVDDATESDADAVDDTTESDADTVEADGDDGSDVDALLEERPDDVEDIDVSSLLEAGPEGVDDIDVSGLFDDAIDTDAPPEATDPDDDAALLEAAASEAGAEDVDAGGGDVDDTDAKSTDVEDADVEDADVEDADVEDSDVDGQDSERRGGLASALAAAEAGVDSDDDGAETDVSDDEPDADAATSHPDAVDDAPSVEAVVTEAEPDADDGDTDVTFEARDTPDEGVTVDSDQTPDIPNAEAAHTAVERPDESVDADGADPDDPEDADGAEAAEAAEADGTGTEAPDDVSVDSVTEVDAEDASDADASVGADAADGSTSADDSETEDADEPKGLFRRFFK